MVALSQVTLVGIDCATKAAKTGLAHATFSEGNLSLCDALFEPTGADIAGRVASWLTRTPASLIAIDAPLGWPSKMSRALSNHAAGHPIRVPPDDLFRRATDDFVRRTVGKRPLEVGADRIARTAVAALKLLGAIRERTGLPLPLAWSPELDQPRTIEVYPAATLVAHRIRSTDYKGRESEYARAEVIDGVATLANLEAVRPQLLQSDDLLDAAICTIAAADFLHGRAAAPSDADLAIREGWIWVASPDD